MRRVKKDIYIVSKSHETHWGTNFLVIVAKETRPVVDGLPVQVGFRTMGNHWEFNIFVALSHVSSVSPLMRDLGLHSYLKTLKILGKGKVFGDAGKMQIRLAN